MSVSGERESIASPLSKRGRLRRRPSLLRQSINLDRADPGLVLIPSHDRPVAAWINIGHDGRFFRIPGRETGGLNLPALGVLPVVVGKILDPVGEVERWIFQSRACSFWLAKTQNLPPNQMRNAY